MNEKPTDRALTIKKIKKKNSCLPTNRLKDTPMSNSVPKDFAMVQKTITEKADAQQQNSRVFVLENLSAITPSAILPTKADPFVMPRIKAPCSGVRPMKTAYAMATRKILLVRSRFLLKLRLNIRPENDRPFHQTQLRLLQGKHPRVMLLCSLSCEFHWRSPSHFTAIGDKVL